MKSNIQIQKASYLLFLIIMSTCMFFVSCVKNDELKTEREGVVYMPQAYQDRGILNLLKVDSVQDNTFGFYYTSFEGAPDDITGNFEVDKNLVAAYNLENAYTGNVYEVLPEDSYTLSGNSTVLRKGKTTSEPLTLSINPKTLDVNKRYMLPIRLVNVSSGTIDSSLAVTYFKVDEIQIRSRDFTVDGTITGNHLNSPSSENLPKLVDNNFTSKYLAFNYNSNLYVQLKFDSPKKLDAYTITSGNDAPERDPKKWTIQGSNNGTDWTTIDERSNETFSGRLQTRTFNLAAQANYSYYRWNISEINGANLIQITEWRLLEYY